MKKRIPIIAALCAILLFANDDLSAQTADQKAFEVKVTGKGEPMLFIPGLTCSSAVWEETIQRYSKNYQCHAFTLAGYAGEVPIAKPPYLDVYKDAIIKYIKDKKLNHVILVGHSIGGFLSLRIASELQTHLQKVIVVDALPFYAGTLNPNAKNGFNELEAKTAFEGLAKMDNKTLKANQLNTARFLCADSTKWDLIATWGANSDRKTMAYSMYEMMGNDIRENIATIKVPILVMAAYAPMPQYPTFTKAYVSSSYQQQYAKCKSCIIEVTPSSKHFIMYDSPEWFFSEIDGFIKVPNSL